MVADQQTVNQLRS